MCVDECVKKFFIIGYGENINNFIEISLYEEKESAIKELKIMKKVLFEFSILDYRIEVFIKKNNQFIHSGETIRLNSK